MNWRALVEELFNSSISGENPGLITLPSPTAPAGSDTMDSSISEQTSGNGSSWLWSHSRSVLSTSSRRLGTAARPSFRAISSLGLTVPETIRPIMRSRSETLFSEEIESVRFRPSR